MIQEYAFQPRQRVISGIGSLARIPVSLEKLGKRRAFILTGNSLATKTDLVSRLEGILGETWAGTFSGCRQHAPGSTVDAATSQAQAARPDVLVSFGGGSPIDTAKIVAHRLLGERSRDDLPQIAIPTTLSAAEFTSGAGTTDEATREKHAVVDPRGMPKVVILDPEATVETPETLWASTGIKALDHAVEALWSPRAHPVTDTLAVEAIGRLNANLKASLDRTNLEARLECQLAAWLSIFGAANVGMRLSHPLGHQIGARWDVPHGVTSCIVLPAVMRFLAPTTESAQVRIARAFGRDDPARPAESAAAAVESLIASLGVPTRLSEAGAIREELPAVAAAVARELISRKVSDPSAPTEAQILGILESGW